jgi:hypothetical protein
MRRREREVREAFHRARALDPSGAQPLLDLGIEESMALRRLQNHEVVRESSPGCFYFDEEVWEAVRTTRMRMGIMILTAVILAALVGVYATSANL